ncbi:hypothetical protein OS493_037529 [Desmophyllum pertusum]|uniref:Protein-tyrosine sulfotransferase n=1 Tax=Desmophyllum pertusum TaxID=174260 RepID=A0A9W9ZIA3_9CNID|nr:hypothetical protein OS493_037529 [Desmophyllum pertusum]
MPMGAVREETLFFSPAQNRFKLYDGVETFVMFIGYPRSRHTLVASFLDAHPEIIIPHEYDVLARWKEYQSSDFKNKNLKKYVLFFNLHKLSTEQAMFGGNRANNKGFYNYNVPGLWQGGYEKKIQINNTTQLEHAIASYFGKAASNQRVRERYGDAVIDIPGHETVLRPKETLQRLCDHLGVTCSEDYFEKCSRILYGAPSVTRDKVVWTEEQKARVTKMMKNYTFLKEYSFVKSPN